MTTGPFGLVEGDGPRPHGVAAVRECAAAGWSSVDGRERTLVDAFELAGQCVQPAGEFLQGLVFLVLQSGKSSQFRTSSSRLRARASGRIDMPRSRSITLDNALNRE